MLDMIQGTSCLDSSSLESRLENLETVIKRWMVIEAFGLVNLAIGKW